MEVMIFDKNRYFRYLPSCLVDISLLLGQLEENYQARKDAYAWWNRIIECLQQGNLFLACCFEKHKIVGMATIFIEKTLLHTKGIIEDVVVNEDQRGKGLGEQLTEKLIEIARQQSCEFIDLTSRPERAAANRLYEKLGFQKRDTNVFRLELRK